ncbi:MAG: hypothetical protein ISR85_07115 [Kiritimatiellales bacterium]|nr:hypothetical protein [Kiritimatiellota bacterium]MBL7012676.1 hypothetical protein [Kiritimatiellales bacterium]
MKKRTMAVWMIIFVTTFFVSAQQEPVRNRNPLVDPNSESAADQFRNRNQKVDLSNGPASVTLRNRNQKVDLSREPASAPVADLDVGELRLKLKDMQGKVVELEFDHTIDLKQTENGYSVRVTFESVRAVEGIMILLPKEGLDFFEPLAEPRSPIRETVYVEVLGNNMTRAVGTRYNKNKPEGERYSW